MKSTVVIFIIFLLSLPHLVFGQDNGSASVWRIEPFVGISTLKAGITGQEYFAKYEFPSRVCPDAAFLRVYQ
jgi:hypothetical protein